MVLVTRIISARWSNQDLATMNNPSKSWLNSGLCEIASGYGLCTACWTTTSIWTLYRIIWLFILFPICNIKNGVNTKPLKSVVIKSETVRGPLIKTKFSWNKSNSSSSHWKCSSGMDKKLIIRQVTILERRLI